MNAVWTSPLFESLVCTIVMIGLVAVRWPREKKRIQRRRRQELAQSQAPMREWMQETARLEGEALAGAKKYPCDGYLGVIPGAREAEDRYDDAVDELHRTKRAQKASKELLDAEQLSDVHEQYEALLAVEDHWLDRSQQLHLIELLRAAATRIFEQLLDRVRAGDTLAFVDARVLLAKHGSPMSVQAVLVAPSDWNDLVARLYENPHLNDFVQMERSMEPNRLLLMSAEALRTRSLTLAKIVLAFCAIKRARYDELGPVMVADLAKLVDAIHAELGLFQHNQETNIPSDS